jgi:hypothetical protein
VDHFHGGDHGHIFARAGDGRLAQRGRVVAFRHVSFDAVKRLVFEKEMGLSISIEASSNPFGVCRRSPVSTMTIPGTLRNHPSTDCEWWGPPPNPPPQAVRHHDRRLELAVERIVHFGCVVDQLVVALPENRRT